jgi:enamine deaminase RidA (YjgF/YER057c/UK114 family)
MRHLPAVERVRRKTYSAPEKAPPSLYAEVINMGRNADCLLEIDVVAARGDRKIIEGHTDGLGRLGAAGRMGGPFLALGGRVARIPETGRIVRSPEDLDERQSDFGDSAVPLAIQARWIYGRVRQFLNEKGSSLAELIKVELYVKGPLNLTSLDAVHKAVFPDGPPAISVIPVTSVDPDPRVEIKICGLANRPGR